MAHWERIIILMWTNSITTTLLLIIIGLGSGAGIAAGVFSLITKIGVITQIAHRTKTDAYVTKYETAVLVGGVTGTVLTIFNFSMSLPIATMAISGLFYGIFLGCLSTALAETLDVTAIFTRRLKLHRGIPFIVLSMALGKSLGSLLYYIRFYFPQT